MKKFNYNLKQNLHQEIPTQNVNYKAESYETRNTYNNNTAKTQEPVKQNVQADILLAKLQKLTTDTNSNESAPSVFEGGYDYNA